LYFHPKFIRGKYDEIRNIKRKKDLRRGSAARARRGGSNVSGGEGGQEAGALTDTGLEAEDSEEEDVCDISDSVLGHSIALLPICQDSDIAQEVPFTTANNLHHNLAAISKSVSWLGDR
jgi:hypothetical protein